ncbi:sulfatase [Halopelagius longus]|uniref:Sulfatase n=1 Tax=Halopelagius longus TaxID=1236180 RepID=A0A1H1GJQ0_9EURY|nr:sulfatase [Halopelagius longus]RDI69703.1 hypothetical protein DWB78_18200 [Halopelagius longus]SDR13349.1 Sulfatase [Halopelagius longus]
MTDVFLVTVDSLRYDRCGFAGYRYDTTPTLDALAAEGVTFTRAMAPGPRTSESVPGIISSRLSADCGYIDEESYTALPHDTETLAKWLGEVGYETLAILSNPQLSPARNFDYGFDTFRNHRINEQGDRFTDAGDATAGGNDVLDTARALLQRLNDSPLPLNPTRVAYVVYRLRQLADWPTVDGAAVIDDLLSEVEHADTPVFAWTHLNDLHTPLHPERVRAGGLVDAGNMRQFWDDAKRVEHTPAPGYERAYDSMVRYVDTQLDRLVTRLKEQGRWDDALVIVTADHGESMHDRGYYGHHAGANQRLCYSDRDYLHHDLLHVPLIVKPPGGASGAVTEPVSLCWLHELIADAVSLPRGDFQNTSGSDPGPLTAYEPAQPVVSDSLTDRGHTVVAHSPAGTVYTNADQSTDSGWWFFPPNNGGEHSPHSVKDAPDELRAACQSAKTDPEAVPEVSAQIDAGARSRLQELGYL